MFQLHKFNLIAAVARLLCFRLSFQPQALARRQIKQICWPHTALMQHSHNVVTYHPIMCVCFFYPFNHVCILFPLSVGATETRERGGELTDKRPFHWLDSVWTTYHRSVKWLWSLKVSSRLTGSHSIETIDISDESIAVVELEQMANYVFAQNFMGKHSC